LITTVGLADKGRAAWCHRLHALLRRLARHEINYKTESTDDAHAVTQGLCIAAVYPAVAVGKMWDVGKVL